MTQRNPSAITESLSVDAPLVQDANHRFNSDDRQYLDNQVRGVEEHLVSSLIRGRHATYIKISGASAALQPGDTVCLASIEASPEVQATKCTTVALANAVAVFGVAVIVGVPGTFGLVAFGGTLPPSITGLAAAAPGFVRVNKTTSRLERVVAFTDGDYGIGVVDAAGNMLVIPGIGAANTVIPGGGSPGGDDRTVQFNNSGVFDGAAKAIVASDGALQVGTLTYGTPAFGDVRHGVIPWVTARASDGTTDRTIWKMNSVSGWQRLNFGSDITDTNGLRVQTATMHGRYWAGFTAANDGMIGDVGHAGMYAYHGLGVSTSKLVFAWPNLGIGQHDSIIEHPYTADPFNGGLGMGLMLDQATSESGNPVGGYWWRSNPSNHHPEVKLPTGGWVDLMAGGAPGAPDRSIQFNNDGVFAGSDTFTMSSDGGDGDIRWPEIGASRDGGVSTYGDLRLAKEFSVYARNGAGTFDLSVIQSYGVADDDDLLLIGTDGDPEGTARYEGVTIGAKRSAGASVGWDSGSSVFAAGFLTCGPATFAGGGATVRGNFLHPNVAICRNALTIGLSHDPFGGGLGVGLMEDQVTAPTGNPAGGYWWRSNPSNHHPEVKLPTGGWLDLLDGGTGDEGAFLSYDGSGTLGDVDITVDGLPARTIYMNPAADSTIAGFTPPPDDGRSRHLTLVVISENDVTLLNDSGVTDVHGIKTPTGAPLVINLGSGGRATLELVYVGDVWNRWFVVGGIDMSGAIGGGGIGVTGTEFGAVRFGSGGTVLASAYEQMELSNARGVELGYPIGGKESGTLFRLKKGDELTLTTLSTTITDTAFLSKPRMYLSGNGTIPSYFVFIDPADADPGDPFFIITADGSVGDEGISIRKPGAGTGFSGAGQGVLIPIGETRMVVWNSVLGDWVTPLAS